MSFFSDEDIAKAEQALNQGIANAFNRAVATATNTENSVSKPIPSQPVAGVDMKSSIESMFSMKNILIIGAVLAGGFYFVKKSGRV